jgi:hypothetical protein
MLLSTFSLLLPPRAVAQLGGENLRGDYQMSPNGAKRK